MKSKLTAIFMTVFPTLSGNTILTASEDTVADWDSITAVALLIAVEREFGIHISYEDIPKLNSFEAYLKYLGAKL